LTLFLALPICSSVGMYQPMTAAHKTVCVTATFRLGFEGSSLLMRLEDISDAPSRTIINYDGKLQAGLTYRATVRGDKVFDLVLVPPLEMRIHQSVGVDWTNLDEFPALKQLRRDASERKIVFKVLSDKTTYMNARRWSRMLRCKIITVE
jgi:hypothetical protein